MIFYIIPPRISIELLDFNKCCSDRLKYFLEAAETNDFAAVADELNSHSEADQIGHFILRCFCAYKPEVQDFIVERESALFLHRLETMSWESKRKSCCDTMEQIRYVQDFRTNDPITQSEQPPYMAELLWPTLNNMCEALIISNIRDHLKENCDNNCTKYFQKVPFQMCLTLLRTRSVTPQRGFAFVPCSQWNSLLAELFARHYEFGLFVISATILRTLESDTRWTLAFATLAQLHDSFGQTGSLASRTRLTARQVDDERRYFPPCMAHLLTVLRTNHRLSHMWRFRLSLFLKDVGLSADESIEFWRSEYSKSCTAESSCTHSWQTNHRKFTYNIRHLYGLVGYSKNSRAKSCQFYQEMSLGMREEGGCPFVHFDDTNLLAALPNEITDDPEVVEKILEHRESQNPTQACYTYQAACARRYGLQIPTNKFKSPVEYYQCMKLPSNTNLDW